MAKREGVTMTAEGFVAAQKRLGLTRAAFCRLLGIGLTPGADYALGRRPVPRVVALAVMAVLAGLEPVG